MITLPNVNAQASIKGNANAAAAAEGASAETPLSQGFMTELGNRLLTLVQQQGDTAQPVDLKADADAKSDKKAALNVLLQALEKPDTLNALLQPENPKAGVKLADDKDNSAVTSLTASDLQNMQALFAMLPVAPTPPTTPQTAQSALTEQIADADVTTAGGNGKRAALLESLLSHTLQQSDKEETQADASTASNKPAAAQSALSQAVASATGSASNAAPAASTNGAALTLDASFKQVLSSVSKADTRDASGGVESVIQPTAMPMSSAAAPLVTGATSSSMTPSTPMLNAQLGSHEWQQALGQQIVMFSRNGQQTAELRLHPADLGAIQINLTLEKDQAQLTMASSHSQVRAALEAALPQLRTALAESGINLGQSNVSSDAFAQSQTHSGQQEGRRDGQHGSFTLAQDSENEITPIAVPAALQARAAGNGAVDIFA